LAGVIFIVGESASFPVES